MKHLRPRTSCFLMLFMLFGITILCIRPAYAELCDTPTPTPSPTPTPVSPEVQALQVQNAILDEQKKAAEARKAIAEAKTAEFKAKFPTPSSTPLEGKTELEGGKLESEIMAYSALKGVARKIAAEIVSDARTIKNLAVYNKQSLTEIQAYTATKSQLDLLRGKYDKILIPPAPPAPVAGNYRTMFLGPAMGLSAAESVLGSFIDLMALLRTDTKITGLAFPVDESTVVSEVFRSVKLERKTTNF